MKTKFLSNILLAAIPAILLSNIAIAGETGCEALRKDLDVKRQRMAGYLVTLDKVRDKGNPELESWLKNKINDLLDAIHKAEEIADCPKGPARGPTEGVSPVKSDAGEYATKSCGELRAMLVQILRRSNPLKRREHSTFSELTPAEKSLLQESERELKAVNTMLKARCTREPVVGWAHGGKKRRSHP
ncbi:MAG: hypothetical protein WBG50_09930 [Desulfomonilaceae bacterium]